MCNSDQLAAGFRAMMLDKSSPHTLYQDRPLKTMEFHFMDNHFHYFLRAVEA